MNLPAEGGGQAVIRTFAPATKLMVAVRKQQETLKAGKAHAVHLFTSAPIEAIDKAVSTCSLSKASDLDCRCITRCLANQMNLQR